MSLLGTGTVAVDTVTTPYGLNEDCVGGSAIFFSMAASIFGDVRLVGVVGDDYPFDIKELFAGKPVDLAGFEVRAGSKTFRWKGSYSGDMGEAQTEKTDLNVLLEEPPVIPASFSDSEFVFLANTEPAIQNHFIDQLTSPRFIVADTMNFWIENSRPALERLLGRVNMLVLNDAEARMFTGESNLILAADKILESGPEYVIIKKGEHGSILCSKEDGIFVLPAYPTRKVVDPTGAGDTFAGGMMGFLARQGRVDIDTLRDAIIHATACASFTVEDFSTNSISRIEPGQLEERINELKRICMLK